MTLRLQKRNDDDDVGDMSAWDQAGSRREKEAVKYYGPGMPRIYANITWPDRQDKKAGDEQSSTSVKEYQLPARWVLPREIMLCVAKFSKHSGPDPDVMLCDCYYSVRPLRVREVI
jgi:hypothetical protein